jgi:hypothetical protein
MREISSIPEALVCPTLDVNSYCLQMNALLQIRVKREGSRISVQLEIIVRDARLIHISGSEHLYHEG